MSVNDYANPEEAQELRAAVQDSLDAGREQSRSAASTKEWLEGRLADQTTTIPVLGREFEFRKVGTETTADILDQINAGADSLAEMPDVLRELCVVLGEHCTDPAMDATAFGRIEAPVVEGIFEELAGGELDEEDVEKIEQFRNE